MGYNEGPIMDTEARKKLLALDVSEHSEKKGKFTYLSWAWAVTEIIKLCPTAVWHYVKDAEGNLCHKDRTGYFVETSVTIDGQTINESHPVLDHRNHPMENPNPFHINTSLKRCLTKNFAMFGLGLYIYAGEDLPDVAEEMDKEMAESNTKKSKSKKSKTYAKEESRSTPNPFKDEDVVSGYKSATLEEVVGAIEEYRKVRKDVLDVKNVKLMSELTVQFPEVAEIIQQLKIEATAPKDLTPEEKGMVIAKMGDLTKNKSTIVAKAKRDIEEPKDEQDVYDE